MKFTKNLRKVTVLLLLVGNTAVCAQAVNPLLIHPNAVYNLAGFLLLVLLILIPVLYLVDKDLL